MKKIYIFIHPTNCPVKKEENKKNKKQHQPEISKVETENGNQII